MPVLKTKVHREGSIRSMSEMPINTPCLLVWAQGQECVKGIFLCKIATPDKVMNTTHSRRSFGYEHIHNRKEKKKNLFDIPPLKRGSPWRHSPIRRSIEGIINQSNWRELPHSTTGPPVPFPCLSSIARQTSPCPPPPYPILAGMEALSGVFMKTAVLLVCY